MNTFEKKLEVWSQKSVEYCESIAFAEESEVDLGFFTFQSEPKENPELLVVNLIPDGLYELSRFYRDKLWNPTRMESISAELYAKANPNFIAYGKKMLTWNELDKSFQDSPMKNLLENSVYINYIPFGVNYIDVLLATKQGKSVFKQCSEYSTELITEIIKPQHILLLGNGNFEILPYITQKKYLIESTGLLRKGLFKGIPIYAVPHLRDVQLSTPNRKKLGKSLQNEWAEAKMVQDSFSHAIPQNLCKAALQTIFERITTNKADFLKKYGFLEVVESTESSISLSFINKEYKSLLSLTISKAEEGFLGFQFLEKNEQRHRTLYTRVLKEYGFQDDSTWLGKIPISKIGCDIQKASLENIENTILTRIKDVTRSLKQAYFCI